MKHVIREGTEKGRGRYWNGAGRFDNNWSARPCDASGMSASLAQKTAQQMGGRVVRLLSAAESRERARQRGVRQVIDAIRAARCSEAMTAAEWSTVILVEKYIVRLLCPCQGADPGPGHVEGCPRGVSGPTCDDLWRDIAARLGASS